jgi:predicted enzyme related to lactoylglutathione lyase
MIGLHCNHIKLLGLALATMLVTVRTSSADIQSDPVVAKGIAFLKSAGGGLDGQVGEVALGALAMIKAEVPASDPALARALAKIMKRFGDASYVPERNGGAEIYEAGVIILALGSLDSSFYKPQIDSCAKYIQSRQNDNGSWDYSSRNQGDTSISQYAVLGLWEAEVAGVSVSPLTWDKAASWFLSSQSAGGSWNYHRDEGNNPETVAMTAAGVGSLLICERQLAPYRANVRILNPFLIPLETEADRRKYTPDVSPKRVTQGIQAGIAWLAANFTTSNEQIIGHSPFYALYGIERIGALADTATLGRRDWFQDGRTYLASKQSPGGAFSAQYGEVPNTAWAVLFLVKSTSKTMNKIQLRKLGAGTLIGGRGLPKDLSAISVAGGHVIARPMDGAVEGMLSVLEDPRIEDAGAALAGLISKYRTEGPKALKPYQDRFRKLLTDQDQGIRRVAAWSLARTGDVSMAVPLIDALKDPDEGVVNEARLSLQLLSRKIEGYGPPLSPTPEQREQAILKWKTWYETVRPLSTVGDDPNSGKTSQPSRRLP